MPKRLKVRDSFEFDGFTFKLLQKTKRTAFYKKEALGEEGQKNIICYEVFCINSLGYYPGDEEFGISAYCFNSIEKAKEKYEELEKR